MTAVHSSASRVAVGLLNVSGYATAYSVSPRRIEVLPTTVLTDKSPTSILGTHDGTFNIEMLLDTSAAANGQFDVFADWQAADPYPITLAPAGFTAGSLAVMINGLETDLTTNASIGSVVTASASGQSTGGVDVGVMVEDYTAITIDTDGTARDNGAATANGGVAHLHVSAFSGLTDDVITIEHSVDGSTSWAVLVTFATVTAVTSERVEVAAGTTVRRHLRVVDNVTGAGSITRAVAFARR